MAGGHFDTVEYCSRHTAKPDSRLRAYCALETQKPAGEGGLSCAFATALVRTASPTGIEPASSTLTTWCSTVELQTQ